jgi:hypothetical protein
MGDAIAQGSCEHPMELLHFAALCWSFVGEDGYQLRGRQELACRY